jgi:hypothetical protein
MRTRMYTELATTMQGAHRLHARTTSYCLELNSRQQMANVKAPRTASESLTNQVNQTHGEVLSQNSKLMK